MSFGLITPMLHDAPCMEYLPTFNIITIHGAYGLFQIAIFRTNFSPEGKFQRELPPPSVIGHVALSENMMP